MRSSHLQHAYAAVVAPPALRFSMHTVADNDAPCADSGQNCANDIYAVSLPSVTSSAYITWFQAQQACKNAAKRLPSNAEWQAAVAGTPDPGPTGCNTLSTPSRNYGDVF